MSARWRRFVAWLSDEEDARPLALARIVIASTVAAHVASFLFSGAADFALLPHADGGLSRTEGWLAPLGGTTVPLLRAVLAVCLAASLAGALGLYTRASLVLTWLTFRAMSGLNPSAHGSYDGLIVDLLVPLMLSGCGRAWSLDAAWRKRGGPARRWTRVVLIVQMGLLYIGSGISKLSASWVPGGDASALWYILQQPTWARFAVMPTWAHPLTQVATTLTWVFEITSPLFVGAMLLRETEPQGARLAALKRQVERWRVVPIYLAFGAAMHIGVELTMEVGPFSYAALALYPAALAPEIRRLLARGS